MNLEEVISVLPVFLSAAIKQRAMGEYNAVPRSNVGEGKQLSKLKSCQWEAQRRPGEQCGGLQAQELPKITYKR